MVVSRVSVSKGGPWRHWYPCRDSKVHGPTWGPSGADRTQVGPMLAPWTLLSVWISNMRIVPLGFFRCFAPGQALQGSSYISGYINMSFPNYVYQNKWTDNDGDCLIFYWIQQYRRPHWKRSINAPTRTRPTTAFSALSSSVLYDVAMSPLH